MCGVCTTKELYEMNSMSEYPYEDKIHSDDKVNYKPTLSISLKGCFFHQDESLNSMRVLLSLYGSRSPGRLSFLTILGS